MLDCSLLFMNPTYFEKKVIQDSNHSPQVTSYFGAINFLLSMKGSFLSLCYIIPVVSLLKCGDGKGNPSGKLCHKV